MIAVNTSIISYRIVLCKYIHKNVFKNCMCYCAAVILCIDVQFEHLNLDNRCAHCFPCRQLATGCKQNTFVRQRNFSYQKPLILYEASESARKRRNKSECFHSICYTRIFYMLAVCMKTTLKRAENKRKCFL